MLSTPLTLGFETINRKLALHPRLAQAAGLRCVRDCVGVRAFRAAYQLVQREHPGFDVNEPLPPVPGLP